MLDVTEAFDFSGTEAAAYFDQIDAKFQVERRSVEPSLVGAHVLSKRVLPFPGLVIVQLELQTAKKFEISLDTGLQSVLALMEQTGGSVVAQFHGDGVGEPCRKSSVITIGEGDGARVTGANVRFLKLLMVSFDGADTFDRRLVSGVRSSSPNVYRALNLLDTAALSANLREQLPRLSHSLANTLADAPTGRSVTGGLAPWQIGKIDRLVRENLSRSLHLHELASHVRLSKSHFCRAFKQTIGIAPHQWIMLTRCQRAKELMLESERALVDVALEVGFSDQSHFTRAFGRLMGIQPATWRRSRVNAYGE